jgi:hypothetical protein
MVNVTALFSVVTPALSVTEPIVLLTPFIVIPEPDTIPELDCVELRKKYTVEPAPNVPPDTNATVDVPELVPGANIVGFTVKFPEAATEVEEITTKADNTISIATMVLISAFLLEYLLIFSASKVRYTRYYI